MYFIEEIISSSLTGTSDIMTLKTAKGLALEDILTEVHTYVHRSKFMFLFVTWIVGVVVTNNVLRSASENATVWRYQS